MPTYEAPTREQILSEPAGPRMDAWVAERVMGWARYEDDGHTWYIDKGDPAFAATSHRCKWWPSTDIAAAWEVVTTMQARERGLILNDGTHHPPTYEVQSGLDENGPWAFCAFEYGGGIDARCARAETAPLAICRAALLTTLPLDEPGNRPVRLVRCEGASNPQE